MSSSSKENSASLLKFPSPPNEEYHLQLRELPHEKTPTKRTTSHNCRENSERLVRTHPCEWQSGVCLLQQKINHHQLIDKLQYHH
jgi:hypothetical protein